MLKNIVFGILGLAVGLAGGFMTANRLDRRFSSAAVPAVAAAESSPVPEASPAAGRTAQTGEQSAGKDQQDITAAVEKAQNQPESFEAQMEVGHLYARLGTYDKAIEYFRRALAINPNDVQANVVLGNAYFDSRNFEQASAAYAKALELNPNDINVRTDYGMTFVEQKTPDYDSAIRELQAALEKDPSHEPTLYYLGVAYFRKGDKASARNTLSKLESVSPTGQLTAKLKQDIGAS